MIVIRSFVAVIEIPFPVWKFKVSTFEFAVVEPPDGVIAKVL